MNCILGESSQSISRTTILMKVDSQIWLYVPKLNNITHATCQSPPVIMASVHQMEEEQEPYEAFRKQLVVDNKMCFLEILDPHWKSKPLSSDHQVLR